MTKQGQQILHMTHFCPGKKRLGCFDCLEASAHIPVPFASEVLNIQAPIEGSCNSAVEPLTGNTSTSECMTRRAREPRRRAAYRNPGLVVPVVASASLPGIRRRAR